MVSPEYFATMSWGPAGSVLVVKVTGRGKPLLSRVTFSVPIGVAPEKKVTVPGLDGL